jgi:hypothetical protein
MNARWAIPGIALAVVAIVVIAAASYMALDAMGDEEPKISLDPNPTYQDLIDEDEAKPRFTGQMGDFEVVAINSGPGTDVICEETPLYNELYTAHLQQLAANRPVGISESGCLLETDIPLDDLESISFHGSLFTGPVFIGWDGPRDRLESATLGGARALVELPVYPGAPTVIWAVAREPTPERPGIFVELHGSAGGVQGMKAAASRVLEGYE